MSIRRQKGRAAPPPQPNEADERLAALLSGDVAAVRAHALRWRLPLIDCDDDTLLESIHRARVLHPGITEEAKAESAAWLRERGQQ